MTEVFKYKHESGIRTMKEISTNHDEESVLNELTALICSDKNTNQVPDLFGWL